MVGDSFRRAMRSVGCTESIVDVDITKGREFLGKIRIVRLFLRMESEILQQKYVSRLKVRGHSGRLFADAIRRQLDACP